MSAEMFLSCVPPEHRVDDDRALATLVERAAALGLPVGISPGDDPLAQCITEQLGRAGPAARPSTARQRGKCRCAPCCAGVR